MILNLDWRPSSVNSFLIMVTNWVSFDKHDIQLCLQDGPTIDIPITSLQSYAMFKNIADSPNKYIKIKLVPT